MLALVLHKRLQAQVVHTAMRTLTVSSGARYRNRSSRPRRQRQPLIVVFSVLLLLQLCHNTVSAAQQQHKQRRQKEEEKPAKTQQPTTARPSELPSSVPTSSSPPTDLSSAFPSAAPTPIHSNAPSSLPSLSAAPSTTPTFGSTLKREVYGALIPVMTFDLLLSEEDAVLPMTRNMDSFFTMFLDRVVDENSDGFAFDYSHLDSNVIVSSFQRNDDNGGRKRNRTRRRLETGYSIQVDGIAYFFKEAPTRASLLHSIKIYFNFWGKEELEEYLRRLGMQSAEVIYIAIDEVPLEMFDEENSLYGQTGASIGQGTSGRRDGLSLPRIVAIVIYIGAILLIPTAALAVLLYGRRKRQQAEKKNEYWKRSMVSSESSSGSSQSEISPRLPSLPVQHDDGEEENSLSLGLMSMDLAVYANGSNDDDITDRSALVP